MKIIKLASILIFIIIFSLPFFSSKPFVAHDWPLFFRESRDFSPFWSLAWDYMGSGGIGGSALKTMWIDLYANFVYFFSNTFNIPWAFSQRIFWLLPFLAFSLFSSYRFSKLFIKDEIFRVLSSIIFTFNTYILLIVGGGQFGIAFAYAIAPLVLYSLFELLKLGDKKRLIISGLLSGIIIALDPRIALLIFGIGSLWFLFFVRNLNKEKLIFIFFNFIIAMLLNSYWILPALYSVFNQSITSSINSYTSLPGVKFLSFATLENTMSFLHPNFPENIFGKIYFQRPEFMILPILAFGSILFKVKKEMLFFAVIGLVGIFLSKGANDPFGEIYLFLFQYVPGFGLFRDATKFYILIAISFSILIPFFLESLSSRFNKYKIVIVLLFAGYLLFILKPGWSGELNGIFKPKQIPQEYQALETLLKNDKDFGRVLWIPRRQKYGFFNPNHPAVNSEVAFKNKKIDKISLEQLTEMSIRYIVVPYDIDGEIFLKDRKYDEKLYGKTMLEVEEKFALKKIPGFGKLAIYISPFDFSRRGLAESKEHFWCDCEANINYRFINPTEYKVSVSGAKARDRLVFSEGFDNNWVASLASQGETLRAQEFGNGLNSFVLPKDGSYELKVFYEPQKWVNIGLLITVITIIISLLLFLPNLAKKPRK
ncbi:hypothetical protein HZA75_06325 [Candidatus Roizmanbacteria bacterium]|nr:hypothetical protein [Candidatus Roizmanbacteria bacterium]